VFVCVYRSLFARAIESDSDEKSGADTPRVDLILKVHRGGRKRVCWREVVGMYICVYTYILIYT